MGKNNTLSWLTYVLSKWMYFIFIFFVGYIPECTWIRSYRTGRISYTKFPKLKGYISDAFRTSKTQVKNSDNKRAFVKFNLIACVNLQNKNCFFKRPKTENLSIPRYTGYCPFYFDDEFFLFDTASMKFIFCNHQWK